MEVFVLLGDEVGVRLEVVCGRGRFEGIFLVVRRRRLVARVLSAFEVRESEEGVVNVLGVVHSWHLFDFVRRHVVVLELVR